MSFLTEKNYLGKEVGLFVLFCFINCGSIFVLSILEVNNFFSDPQNRNLSPIS